MEGCAGAVTMLARVEGTWMVCWIVGWRGAAVAVAAVSGGSREFVRVASCRKEQRRELYCSREEEDE